jgi:hypothetical protein
VGLCQRVTVMVLQWCYSNVREKRSWCEKVTVIQCDWGWQSGSHGGRDSGPVVLQWCYNSVKVVLQWCQWVRLMV